MSDLTEGQIAQCSEISRRIITEVLENHVKTCPHYAAWLVSKARVWGIAIGIIVASGVSSGTAVALMMKLLNAGTL